MAALYLALQLVVPLCVIARNELSSRDFSWDMFSYHLSCRSLEVRSRAAARPWLREPIERDFSSWAQLRRVLSNERFSAYAQDLCRRRQAVGIRILSQCQSDRDSQPFAILDPTKDYCAAHQ